MLRIIEGGFSSYAFSDIKKEILSHTESKRRVFLIVPEQQAVIAEWEMMSYLPDSAPLTFEVTNFTRLANTVSRSLGGIAGEFADRGKESLIMWKTLSELSPVLSLSCGEEINTGTVEKMLSAVSEMKNISATPEELASLSENEGIQGDKRLVKKIRDLSKVMALYKKLLYEKYADAKDECERLAEKLSQNPGFFEDSVFYVSGFTSFTEPQYKVLSELMRFSELTLHLTISKNQYTFFEFSEIKKTKERALRAADITGCDKKLIHKAGCAQNKKPVLSEACDLLWRNFGKIDEDNLKSSPDAIRIFEACDPYEECNFIASDIKRRVISGAKYSDFAIIARDAEKYSGILDTALDSANIPAFISRRKDISSYEAIKLIYTAFSAVISGFARGDVISYAKCRLSGITPEACDEFELYTETWQLTKNRFTDGIFWNMNPNGYSTKKNEETDLALLRIDDTRNKLINPLIKFSENISESKSVRDFAKALSLFMSDISLEEKIEEQRLALMKLGEANQASENEKLWEVICTSLDSIVEVLGDTEITLRGFLSQLKVIISSADIGRIPAFSDEVTVGSADMIRLSDKKHVYIIGVNFGEFPRSKEASSYFTDKDKASLAALGLATEANEEIPHARELFFFSRAFSVAADSVTVSYSTRDEALSASSPSDVIERFSVISGKIINPVRISQLPPEEKLYFPALAIEFSGREDIKDALIKSGFSREVGLADERIQNSDLELGEKTAKLMYPSEIALTQTRIESYINCPFSYYLKYNIRLSENERAEFDARNIGTFIHSILESFFGELSMLGISAGDVDEQKKQDMVAFASQKYLSSLTTDKVSSKRFSFMLDRICRVAMPVVDSLCDELKECKFVPRFFELKIDNDDESLPRPATFKDSSGGDVYVYGSIDRVDTYKSGDDVYVRVIRQVQKTLIPVI